MGYRGCEMSTHPAAYLPDDHPVLSSPERAVERLDLGRTKALELIATGELESVGISRSRRIPAEAVTCYVVRLRVDQNGQAAS